jgi:hypothetical protein
MERRGFIGKFAKVIAGAALSAEEMINEAKRDSISRARLPRIIKVTDETVFKNGGVVSAVLHKMISAAINEIFQDITEEELLATLFPGISSESKIGVKIYDIAGFPSHFPGLAETVIDALKTFTRSDTELTGQNFVIWKRGGFADFDFKSNQDAESDYILSNGASEIESDDSPIEVGDYTLTPFPILSKVCQFQVMLVSASGDISGVRPCQKGYLSCFKREGHPDYPEGLDWRECGKAFETVGYPLSMKFRLYILDRLVDENTLYFCTEGILIDNLFPGEGTAKNPQMTEIVQILNPSVEEVNVKSIRRIGEDIIIEWNDQDYNDEYQVYRSAETNFVPAKNLLIGITKKHRFTDYGASHIKEKYYIITRRWGF